MYILFKSPINTEFIQNEKGGMFKISPDNTDYQQFKKDIQNGVVLNDAEGNPITGSALTTFMETLP